MAGTACLHVLRLQRAADDNYRLHAFVLEQLSNHSKSWHGTCSGRHTLRKAPSARVEDSQYACPVSPSASAVPRMPSLSRATAASSCKHSCFSMPAYWACYFTQQGLSNS